MPGTVYDQAMGPLPASEGNSTEPQSDEPTAGQLEATRAAELQALAEADRDARDEAIIQGDGDDLDALDELDPAERQANVAADLAEYGKVLEAVAADPEAPSVSTIEALTDRLAEIAEADTGDYSDVVLELEQALEELAKRKPPLTEAEQAELELQAELEKARVAYGKKIRKLVGPDADLEECQACGGRGFAPAEAAELIEYNDHPKYRQCPSCSGRTGVKTGSLDPEYALIGCPDCGARGYQDLLEPNSSAPTGAAENNGQPHYGVPPWMGDPNLKPAYT